MADLILLTANHYELGPVSVTSEAAGFPKERLFDRDRSPLWKATGAATQSLKVDTGASRAGDAWAIFTHNLAVTLTLEGSDDDVSYTPADTFNPGSADFLRLFTSLVRKFWRVTIPNPATTPQIGELVVGVKRQPSLNPSYRRVTEAVVGNIQRDESPGGYVWKAKRGSARTRLVYGWEALPTADWTALKTAYNEVDQSTKNLVLQDLDGTARWVEWVRAEAQAAAVDLGLWQVELEFLEAV